MHLPYLDPRELIEAFGYIGLFGIVLAESGLFFGFFLPGDSLLLTAGLLAYRGHLNIWVLLPLLFVAAVIGDNIGYWFGRKAGHSLYSRPDSFFFRQEHLRAASEFYERHGGKTIVIARFMPFIRTFAPIVAGAVDMEYRRFMFFNLIGALIWAVGVTLAGYFLPQLLPEDMVDQYFTRIVLVVIILSVLPTAVHLARENQPRLRAWLERRRAADSARPLPEAEAGEPEL